ncbi:hypothetical protein SmphiM6_82 [Sinorhizobium phage phiM6]|nr:hypothetical protein SmphiM6_82 [Sinorhizobium phage phiM6]
MKFQSIIHSRGTVQFPEFMAERVYMREFYKGRGLPSDLKRWQPVVDTLLEGVDTDGPIYLMVDEGEVKAGSTHRREGLHIDGYWNPTLNAHGGGHMPSRGGGHGYEPRDISVYFPKRKRKQKLSSGWDHATFEEAEGLILASSISACVGYVGEFEGPIKEGGDCSHIDLSPLKQISMERNVVYAGNVTALHESVPVEHDCLRQLVRLNVPGWSPNLH